MRILGYLGGERSKVRRPRGKPTAFVDGIDHEESPRSCDLASGIERAQELIHGQVGQIELARQQCTRVSRFELLPEQKHCWTTFAETTKRDVA